MSGLKSIRIPVSNAEKVVTLELKNDYDSLEILSLKFSQTDVYQSGLCSDYGVVAGRISANNGLGIPNAKVSIFTPLNIDDELDPVISALYPYKEISNRDDNGYRYNLLPKRKQHGGHTPTGTFFDQNDILSSEEYLEVFEKYYTYTVKTNDSGDFMIWGVPIGEQVVHVDVDLSDIGCFSLRPYDFIRKGVGADNFERSYSFKSSSDIDGLPQIVKFDKTIQVYPFIGNEEMCEIGISRVDFDLTEKDIKIEPIALILASSFTDDNGVAMSKTGKIKKEMGYKCGLQTSEGKIECVRFTGKNVTGNDGVTIYPELEYFNITETIDASGSAMVVIPMNLDYMYTNEFGEMEITSDTNKGVPTTTMSRFRLSLDFSDPKIQTAKYLIPNIREYYDGGDMGVYNQSMMCTYTFSDVFEDYLTVPTSYNINNGVDTIPSNTKLHKKGLILNFNSQTNEIIPKDYFYKFIYGKVYTVSSFQGSYDGVGGFLGVKEIRPSSENDCGSSVNYIPTNHAYKNTTKFTLLLSEILLFLQYCMAVIINTIGELLGSSFIDLGDIFDAIKIDMTLIGEVRVFGEHLFGPVKLYWAPFNPIKIFFNKLGYGIQNSLTQVLSLINYPDCEECSTDEESINSSSGSVEYCRIGEIKMLMNNDGTNVTLTAYSGGDNYFRNTITGNTFLNTIFSGEKSREPYSGCTDCFTLDYDTLSNLNSVTLTINGVVVPRYYGMVYPINNIGEYSFNNYKTDFTGSVNTLLNSHFTNGSYDIKYISYDIPTWENMTQSKYTQYTKYVYTHIESGTTNNFREKTGIIEPYPYVNPNDPLQTGYTSGMTISVSQDLIYKTYITTEWGDGRPITTGNTVETTQSSTPWTPYLPKPGSVFINDTESGFTQSSVYEYSGPYNFLGNNDPLTDFTTTNTYYDDYTYAVIRIYDRSVEIKDDLISTQLETDCKRYDTVYNDNLLYKYIFSSGTTYDSPLVPTNENGYEGTDWIESISEVSPKVNILSTIIGDSTTSRLPYQYEGKIFAKKTKSGLSEFRDGVFYIIPVVKGTSKNFGVIKEWYRRKRINTAFCGGVINYSFINNWLHGTLYFFKFKKRIMWDDESVLDLNVRGSKYPTDLIFFNILDNNFYYRSTPYTINDGFVGFDMGTQLKPKKLILHPTTFYDVGVRDEFFGEICTDPRVDPTYSVIRDIGVTSYQEPGNIMEYAISYKMDINNGDMSVTDFFDSNSNLNGDITQLMSINCETGVEGFDLDNPQYFMYNNEFLDPENINYKPYFIGDNGNYGPTPIDLKFFPNGENNRIGLNHFLGDYAQEVPFYLWNKYGTDFGNDNITNKLEGRYNQKWDLENIAHMTLQNMFSISSYNLLTTNYNFFVDGNDDEKYLLKPITKTHGRYLFTGVTIDMLERFDKISLTPPPTDDNGASGYTEGQLWLKVNTYGGTDFKKDPQTGDIYVVKDKKWSTTTPQYVEGSQETFLFETQSNYSGNKQVLSTPFLFYFGLRPENTSLDLLLKYFGPKGAFPSTD